MFIYEKSPIGMRKLRNDKQRNTITREDIKYIVGRFSLPFSFSFFFYCKLIVCDYFVLRE